MHSWNCQPVRHDGRVSKRHFNEFWGLGQTGASRRNPNNYLGLSPPLEFDYVNIAGCTGFAVAAKFSISPISSNLLVLRIIRIASEYAGGRVNC